MQRSTYTCKPCSDVQLQTVLTLTTVVISMSGMVRPALSRESASLALGNLLRRQIFSTSDFIFAGSHMESYAEIMNDFLHYTCLLFFGIGTCLWLGLLSLEVRCSFASNRLGDVRL